MDITLEEMKAEALKRMRKLKLLRDVKEEFNKDESHIFASESYGFLYYAWNGTEYSYEKDVEELATELKEKGHLPYHAIVNQMKDGGIMISMLYVSKHQSEWEYCERPKPIINGYRYLISAAVRYGQFSDYGDIVVMPCFGGLRRMA